MGNPNEACMRNSGTAPTSHVPMDRTMDFCAAREGRYPRSLAAHVDLQASSVTAFGTGGGLFKASVTLVSLGLKELCTPRSRNPQQPCERKAVCLSLSKIMP